MRLQIGKRYELYSGDIIEVVEEAMSNTKDAADRGFGTLTFPADASEPVCKCKLVGLRRNPAAHAMIATRMLYVDYPGCMEGDVMEYLVNDGKYCGHDNRIHPFHVKHELPNPQPA